ncbi:hypothetical protein PSPO01_04173 [Paraphaeosphaeria sporulosa]
MLSLGGAVWVVLALESAAGRARVPVHIDVEKQRSAEFGPFAISPSATLTNTCSDQQDRQELIANPYCKSLSHALYIQQLSHAARQLLIAGELLMPKPVHSRAANCPRPLPRRLRSLQAGRPTQHADFDSGPDNAFYSPSPHSHLSYPTSRSSRLLDPILPQGIGI